MSDPLPRLYWLRLLSLEGRHLKAAGCDALNALRSASVTCKALGNPALASYFEGLAKDVDERVVEALSGEGGYSGGYSRSSGCPESGTEDMATAAPAPSQSGPDGITEKAESKDGVEMAIEERISAFMKDERVVERLRGSLFVGEEVVLLSRGAYESIRDEMGVLREQKERLRKRVDELEDSEEGHRGLRVHYRRMWKELETARDEVDRLRKRVKELDKRCVSSKTALRVLRDECIAAGARDWGKELERITAILMLGEGVNG